jgi:hypothetical protein
MPAIPPHHPRVDAIDRVLTTDSLAVVLVDMWTGVAHLPIGQAFEDMYPVTLIDEKEGGPLSSTGYPLINDHRKN